MRYALAMAAVAGLALQPGGAGAEETGGKLIEELVVTATRAERALGELAGNTASISRDELDLLGATHPTEALYRSPGTWISRGGSGQEHLTAIRSPVLTGPGSCAEFMLAQDGIHLRPTGFCNVNEMLQANTEQAERIEVMRGPGTVFYGSNALHGVINVITAAPSQEPTRRGSMEFGEEGFARLKATTASTSGRHGYRLNANVTHDDGWRDDSAYDQHKLDLRHAYAGDGLEIDTIFSATRLDQDTAGFITGFEAYRDKDRITDNENPEAYRKVASARLLSRISRQLDAQSSLTLTPYVLWGDMEFLMHFLVGTPLEENGYSAVGLQTAYGREIGGGALLTAGIDLEYADSTLEQTQEAPGFSRFPQGKHYDYDVTSLQLAPFVHGEWPVAERIKLVGGIRYEWLEYDYENNMRSGNTREDGSSCVSQGNPIPCRYSRPGDRTDAFDNWAAQLGAVFTVDGANRAYINLAHAFRAPQSTDLYRLQEQQQVSEIDSTELNGVEVGLRGERDAWSYDLAAFYMRKENYIYQDSARFNLSDGKTRHYGLEFELMRRLGAAWDFATSATFARHLYAYDAVTPGGESINDGDEIDTAPSTLASTRLGWNFRPRGRIELEWLHVGSYYADSANEHRYAGHDLLHLRGRLALNRTLTLFGQVQNLTDARYAERADWNPLGSTGDRYFPGRPRTFFVGVQVNF